MLLATIVFLCLALIATQVFLHQTSVGSPRFQSVTFLLWTATVVVVVAVLILATVLGRDLIKLYFERKSGKLGSGFKTKIVSIFVALSLLPALLLFLLAYMLVSYSIDQWFSAPATQMMDNSRAIAAQYYDDTQQRSNLYAANIASVLGSEEGFRQERVRVEQKLDLCRRQYHLDDIRAFDDHARLVAESGRAIPRMEQQESQLKLLVSNALRGQPGFKIDRVTPKDALKEVIWTTAAIRDQNQKTVGAVLTETINPQSVYFQAYSVMEAYAVYEQLQGSKVSLRFNMLLMLALFTLLIVFAFSWFAMYLSKRITIPIQALAEGAAAVAAGNLAYRVECDAFDELGSLVASFNRMTSDLQENKTRIEAAQDALRETNVKLDNRRRYIETILQTIATGVISIDSNYRVRTINRAAMQMLEVQGPVAEAKLEEVVKGPACETLRMLLHKSAVLGPVVRNIELTFPGKTLHLATTVTFLVDSAGQRTGWVVALDDVTELLRVEKMAAWQEVARRLAHEIKNPLTPIQLSAERLLRRYKQLLPNVRLEKPSELSQDAFASFDNLMEECVKTIIQEAGSLKNLVDEFSRFARLPEVKPEEADLHNIIDNTLYLYNGRIQDVQLEKAFAPDIPKLRMDPEQMKRVFINLFDNALEAMADNTQTKILRIRTSCNTLQRSVRIEISDTGRGFPEEYQDSLFLPYFSTRRGGTGLGLAIVRQIISDHHGYVRAEPNVPLGTKIVIDLPLAPA
jgi:two-component system nitrogen regulation sensor histidine kinase NtrY